MRRFAAVTTCHFEGYLRYGRRMVASFDRHWPAGIPLYLYAEGFDPKGFSRRIVPLDLLAECPELAAFKERHKHNRLAHGAEPRTRLDVRVRWRKGKLRIRPVTWGLGFRWDAVRFSHKVFSTCDAAVRCGADVLFWVDADTTFFKDVPPQFMDELIPADCLLSYLARHNTSECGFVAYNLRHPAVHEFLDEFKEQYTSDLLFKQREFHDSYLFDIIRKRFEKKGYRTHDIGEGIGQQISHVLINSKLGNYMDHLKGSRKEYGASRATDLAAEKREDERIPGRAG